jgi:LuxR family maltose regulon positive regulatory protein
VSAPLLATKLYVPPTRPELVARPRLIDKLNAGLGQRPAAFARKLTLVSAPAGYGKTTLVSAWLQHLQEGEPERAATWLSLDGGDNAPVRFFSYLVAALQRIDGAIGRDTEELLEAAQRPPVEPLVTSLINDMTAAQASLVLVLDDYHSITELTIHQGIEFLLERQPPQMHLVIITRQDPSLPISRLRARGQVTEIRQGDLRFTDDEATVFFNESMGLALTASDVGTLQERTESWVTGLQMAALALQPMVASQGPPGMPERGAEGTAQFIATFSGRHHFILDYLTDEILQRQSGAVQAFLLQTAILDRMCGPLCDRVMGQDVDLSQSGQATLEMLQKANLFVVPLDDERRWYRYHRLFADLLQARLQEIRPGLVPQLHRRAATWYEENALASEAIHHVLATDDLDLAADVIERTIMRISTWSRLEVATLLGWLKALPDDVLRRRPWLWLFLSRALFSTGQLQAGERMLDELATALREDPSLPDAGQVLGLVAADQASYAAVRGNVRQAREFAQRLLAHVGEDDVIGQVRALAVLGMACTRSGDVRQAEDAFSQAINAAQAAGMSFVAVPLVCNLADAQVVQGRLRQAFQTCERAEQMGTVDGKRISPAGFAGLVRGKILYEQNKLQAAQDALLDSLKLLGRGGIAESYGNVRAVLAQVKEARGDRDGALAAIERAVQITAGSGMPRLTELAAAYQARIWLAQGRLEMAAQWARDQRLAGETEYLREFEHLTAVRVLIASEQPGEALGLLDTLLPPAQAAGRMGVVIEGQSLRALAVHALGDLDGALDALASSLALAEPEGYVRVFVDSGEPMRTLLKQAASRGIAPVYVARLLAAFGPPRPEPPDQARTPGQAQPLVEPLTDRELEVLRHLDGGFSNREIARRLFVSLPTVKSHTQNIYGKLGVHSREQAVARARALGLLPSP